MNDTLLDYPAFSLFFARPHLLSALIFLPLLLLLFLALYRFRQRELYPFLPLETSGTKRRLRSTRLYCSRAILFGLSYLFLILSWMGPLGPPIPLQREEERDQQQQREERPLPHDLLLLIDASASMMVEDGRLGQSRLDHAKEIASLFIEQLRGEQIALYAFTSEVTPLSPLTSDYLFVLLQLRDIQRNEGDSAGTNFPRLLTTLKQLKPKLGRRKQTVILFSDGGDEELSKERREQLLTQVALLTKGGMRFLSVGMGSREGGVIPQLQYQGQAIHSQLNADLLQQIAKQGEGRYFIAHDYSTLPFVEQLTEELLSQERDTKREDDRGEEAHETVEYEELFWRPLLAAWWLFSLFLLCPERSLRSTSSN